MGPQPNHEHLFRRSLLVTEGGPSPYEAGLFLEFSAWPDGTRVPRARKLAEEFGCPDAESLRRRFPLPEGAWVCRPVYGFEPPPVPSVLDPLHVAVLLGLCGLNFYEPNRPLIWTEARLGRVLQLHRPVPYEPDTRLLSRLARRAH